MKDYLIIERSKWVNGGSKNKGNSCLLNSKGNMCCLGFRCNQMGIPKKDLLQKYTPESLSRYYEIPDLLTENGFDTNFTEEAIDINDDNYISNKEREKRLITHFAEKGITVQFKGKYK